MAKAPAGGERGVRATSIHRRNDFRARHSLRWPGGPSVGGVIRVLKPYQYAVDALIALFCLAMALIVYQSSGIFVIFSVFGMATSLVFRRWSPALALGIAWLTVALQLLSQPEPNLSNLAVLPILFGTAAYGTRLVKWLGFASAFVGALLATGYLIVFPALASSVVFDVTGANNLSLGLPSFVASALILFFSSLTLFLLSWTLGLLAKTWRDARESRREQFAARQQQLVAERDVVVEQERNRIARDMHDVVAHSLAVVIAQADGARYARVNDPEASDVALTTISETAREALGDVRLLLSQLRHSESAGPQPSLEDLDRLFEQMRSAGLQVDVGDEGPIEPLGSGPQLAIYRIIQEALTNALRHGDPESVVSVQFTRSDAGVELNIRNRVAPGERRENAERDDIGGRDDTRVGDDTVRGESVHIGHGLPGMRERALLAGGQFGAQALDDDFVISAFIPRATARQEVIR